MVVESCAKDEVMLFNMASTKFGLGITYHYVQRI